MVKVAAPCLSLGASGALGGAIVFSTWKGRAYVRELVKPSNPRSGGQVGIRSMFKFLSQDWSLSSSPAQATWETRADDKVISPFNAYVGYNQARWRNFKAPSNRDPADEAGPAGVYENEAATAGVRQVDVEIEVTAVNYCWGVMIFRAPTTAFTTSFANCVAVIPTRTAAVHHWIDTPLVPGTYYYNFRGFSTNGLLNAQEGEVDATVV